MAKKKTDSRSYLRQILTRLKRLFPKKAEPEDPYACRMTPVGRPPHGRSGAAVAELDEA